MEEVEKLFNKLKKYVVGKSTETEEEATQIKVNECLTGIEDLGKEIAVLKGNIDGPGEGQGGGRRRRRSKKSKKRARKNSKRGNISKKR